MFDEEDKQGLIYNPFGIESQIDSLSLSEELQVLKHQPKVDHTFKFLLVNDDLF